MTPHVVVEDLEKRYVEGSSRRTILARASASIASGEIVAIRGRSGSGKTTLLNLVAGLDLADRGVVRVAGQDIQAMNDRQRTLFRRRHCGFVFQFFNLIPTLSVQENLMIGPELNGVPRERREARGRELLAQIGLAGRAGSLPDQLSGGEQQRVALARALAHQPGLVLADEPTGNLDADTEVAILELLRGLSRDTGVTVMIATHSDLVAGYADRVLAIDAGVLSAA